MLFCERTNSMRRSSRRATKAPRARQYTSNVSQSPRAKSKTEAAGNFQPQLLYQEVATDLAPQESGKTTGKHILIQINQPNILCGKNDGKNLPQQTLLPGSNPGLAFH